MANTIKLGNGNWATKEGSLLAYNDENNNFKPLPFTTTRASSATVVNKQGLIETVGSGIPRIDFSDDTNGALLLEPTRSNSVDNSTNFFLNSWSGTRVSEGSTIVSPNGQDEAHKLIASSVSNTHYREYIIYSASSGSYTGSCFFKKGEFNVGSIRMSVDSYANRIGVYINLDNGTHLQTSTVGSPTGTSYKIEDYGNGWYRFSVTITHTSGEVRMSLSNASSDYTNSSGLPLFLGNSSDGGYTWGAQLEQGSYATSYIPTQGTSQTRVADTASGSGNSTVINSTEGVLYAEISALADDGTSRRLSISDGTPNNHISIDISEYTNTIIGRVRSSNIEYAFMTIAGVTQSNTNKIALKYKSNDCSLWVNGVELVTDISVTMPIGLSELSFDKGESSNNFYGKAKDVRVYTTALSDAELTTLTTI